MFGFFKKRREMKKLELAATNGAISALLSASSILRNQVSSIGDDVIKIHPYIHSVFARGYIYGFIEASIVKSGVKYLDDMHLSILVMLGHAYFFDKDPIKAQGYWAETQDLLERQKDADCLRAKDLGAIEYKSMITAQDMPESLAGGYFSQR